MEKKDFNGVRKCPYIVFVAAIWVGCRMYHVCGNDGVECWDFHTKKDAAAWIRDNFTGDERRVRLYDLKHCTDFYSKDRVKKY